MKPILSLLAVLLISTCQPAQAQSLKPSAVEVEIYSPEATDSTFSFDVKLRAGQNYGATGYTAAMISAYVVLELQCRKGAAVFGTPVIIPAGAGGPSYVLTSNPPVTVSPDYNGYLCYVQATPQAVSGEMSRFVQWYGTTNAINLSLNRARTNRDFTRDSFVTVFRAVLPISSGRIPAGSRMRVRLKNTSVNPLGSSWSTDWHYNQPILNTQHSIPIEVK
jgi:hypothetical protein